MSTLEAGVDPPEQDPRVGSEALEVGCVCAVPADQQHCWHLQNQIVCQLTGSL